MHGVMKVIHGWAESASTGLKLATVCMCVFYKCRKLCKIQYTMLSLRSHTMYLSRKLLWALIATSIRVSGSVWEGSTQLLQILQDKESNTIGGWLTPLFLAFVQSDY